MAHSVSALAESEVCGCAWYPIGVERLGQPKEKAPPVPGPSVSGESEKELPTGVACLQAFSVFIGREVPKILSASKVAWLN